MDLDAMEQVCASVVLAFQDKWFVQFKEIMQTKTSENTGTCFFIISNWTTQVWTD